MSASRQPQSLAAELAYWQQVLGDVKEAHDLIGRGADELIVVPVELVTVAVLAGSAAVQPPLERAMGGASAAMGTLRELQGVLVRLLDLLGGRAIMLDRELDELRGEL